MDAIYFCPEAPAGDDRTVVEHADRKPGPGMLIRAAEELGLDLDASWMVGDMISDVLAGINARCRGSILVRTGKGRLEPEGVPGLEYLVADDLAAAADLILACPADACNGLVASDPRAIVRPSWRAESMKILLTGGAGYIGSACLRWLLRHGHDPIAYDNLCEGNAAAVPDGRLVVGDLDDAGRMAEVMREHRSEAVMHFAALASVPDSIADPDGYYRVNVVGDEERPRRHAAGRGRADRLQQHRRDLRLPRRDAAARGLAADPRDPLRHDQARRRMADQGLRPRLRHGLHHAPLLQRLGGRPRRPSRRGPPPRGAPDPADPPGRGRPSREVADLRRRLGHAATGPASAITCTPTTWRRPTSSPSRASSPAWPGPTTSGPGPGVSVLEVLRACEAVVGRPIRHEIVGRRPGDPATLIATPEKITRELGWSPRFTDIRAIAETAWRWHSTHPQGYGSHSHG